MTKTEIIIRIEGLLSAVDTTEWVHSDKTPCDCKQCRVVAVEEVLDFLRQEAKKDLLRKRGVKGL